MNWEKTAFEGRKRDAESLIGSSLDLGEQRIEQNMLDSEQRKGIGGGKRATCRIDE